MKCLSPLLLIAALALFVGPVGADQKEQPKTPQTCCQKAHAQGKECAHRCCIAAHRDAKSCQKCNPNKEDLAFLKKDDTKKK
jgi:hypothetical protein